MANFNVNIPKNSVFDVFEDIYCENIFLFCSKDESLWHGFDLTGRTVNAVALLNFLNRGVRVLGLAQTEVSI